MGNHEILLPTLQKYYSALKSINEFGVSGNFFDDISNLDRFFSEFRNITFMIQKSVGSEKNKEIYIQLREKYFSNDVSKWFINTRNETTKQHPFNLKKELVIDIYLPGGAYTLQDSSLEVDFDESFTNALMYIKDKIMDKLEFSELNFTTKLLFKEGKEEIEFYPKIRQGLFQMNSFLNEFEQYFPCECSLCERLKHECKEMYERVQMKELTFTTDYMMNKDEITGASSDLFIGNNNGEIRLASELRMSLKDHPFYGASSECIDELFLKFLSSHITIYRMQGHDIMPVFMLVYNDKSFRLIPFIAVNRASVYRKVVEITNMSDFDELKAVFYCGEYYDYSFEDYKAIYDKSYEERSKMAKKVLLSFSSIKKGEADLTISFDENKVDDNEYVRSIIKKSLKNNEDFVLDWLSPIKDKMNRL